MPQPITNCYTPQQVTEIVGRTGVYKANMRLDKSFMSSVSSGIILSFACATLLSTNAAPWYQENAPGVIRTLGALVFPYGLETIILTGADLCTTSFMFTTVAALQRRLGLFKLLLHWVVTFSGNLAGSLFVDAIIFYYGGVFQLPVYQDEIRNYATTKQATPMWHQVFLRAIGANMLVCLACFLGLSGRDYVSKVVGIWWPTFAFVSLGLDHLVANMTFIPLGIFYNTPGISIGLYIWKGMIPTAIGNIIGGGFFVGAFYYYLHLTDTEELVIDGEAWSQLAGDKKRKRTSDVELGEKRLDSESM